MEVESVPIQNNNIFDTWLSWIELDYEVLKENKNLFSGENWFGPPSASLQIRVSKQVPTIIGVVNSLNQTYVVY